MSSSADYQEELTQSTEIMYIDLHSFCQTQPQLNSTLTQTKAEDEDSLNSTFATHPPNQKK